MPADQTTILAEVAELLCAIRDDLDAEEITMDAGFRDDLGIESIDVVALAGRLQARYGGAVNFTHLVAGLDLESVSQLRVRDVVGFIAESLDRVGAGTP